VSNASPRNLTSNRKSSIESPQTEGDSSQSPYPSHVNPRGNPHTHGSPGYHPSRGCRGYRSSPRRRTNRHRIVRRHGAKSRRRFNKPRAWRAPPQIVLGRVETASRRRLFRRIYDGDKCPVCNENAVRPLRYCIHGTRITSRRKSASGVMTVPMWV